MEFLKQYLFENDLGLMIPEIYLVGVILVLLVLGVTFDKHVISLGVKVMEVVAKLGILGTVFTLLLYVNQMSMEAYIFSYQVSKDRLSYFLISLVLIGLISCLMMSLDYMKRGSIDEYEYVLLMLLAVSGIITLITANDLVVIYLGIELQSLALYILAAMKQYSNFSTEAGLKYFVLGAFSSGLLLFGMSLLYGYTGLTNLSDINYIFMDQSLDVGFDGALVVSLLCILAALLFKLGAAPFHMWLPDVYEGAPTGVTAFFAIVPKIAIVGLIGKLYYSAWLITISEWNVVFVYSALLSLFIGSIGALYQTRVKRLIAYSAITNTGFILLAFAAGSLEGMFSVYLYVLIYMVLTINMFSILLSLRRQSDFRLQKLIGNLSRVYSNNKVIGVSLCLLLFSMAGVPPLAGFFSKLYVLFAIMKSGLYLVSICAVLFSVVGSVYYIKLIRTMFFNTDRVFGFYFPVEKNNAYVLVYSTLLGLLFCVYSLPITMFVHELVLSHYL